MNLRNWRPLPQIEDDEQDDYDTLLLTPLAEPDTEPLDAIADDLIKFGERLAQDDANGDNDGL